VDVSVLGTGAPAGFPEPGCRCAACAAAAARGQARAATAVLVDGTLLLDLTPGVLLAAARAGRSLHGVQQVLLTHPHDGPAVAFPAELPPPVRVPDGRELTLLSGHRVRAIALDSPGTGYAVSGPDGQRLLYLPPGGAPAGLGDGEPRYDLCLLDVLGRPESLARLRASGAADRDTEVIAVHLGHAVPPGGELTRRLAAAGAREVPDGTALRTGGAAGPPPVPRRTLVLGGPGAGQSQEAERRLATFPEVHCVLPDPGARRDGRQGAGGPAWQPGEQRPEWTRSGPAGLPALLAADGPPLLIDGLPHWLASTASSSTASSSTATDAFPAASPAASPANEEAADPVAALAGALRRTARLVVLVSEDRPELARLNAAVAAECEQVLWMTAGTVLPLRG
jgi:adenosylcobinamide kinase/adenosylcobinamide-phosphate guanylyltransferase